jgi:hypothetical protein
MNTFNPKAKKYYRKDGTVKSLSKYHRSAVAHWLLHENPMLYWVGNGAYTAAVDDDDQDLLETVRSIALAASQTSNAEESYPLGYGDLFDGLQEINDKLFDLRDVLYRYFFDKYLRNAIFEEAEPIGGDATTTAVESVSPRITTSYKYSINNSENAEIVFALNGAEEINVSSANSIDKRLAFFFPAAPLFRDGNPAFFAAYESGAEVSIHVRPRDKSKRSKALVLAGKLEFHSAYEERCGCKAFGLIQSEPWDENSFEKFSFVERASL